MQNELKKKNKTIKSSLPTLLFEEYFYFLIPIAVEHLPKNEWQQRSTNCMWHRKQCFTLDINLLPRERLTKASKSLRISWQKEATVPKTIETIMSTTQVIGFPSISCHFSAQHEMKKGSSVLKNEVWKPTVEGTWKELNIFVAELIPTPRRKLLMR